MKRELLLFVGMSIPFGLLLGTFVNCASAQTNFTMLKSFSGAPDGVTPACTLVDGKDGAFYGTTGAGGTSNFGTVFRLSQDGSGLVITKNFIGTDGAVPFTGLVLGTDGNLFGTTYGGGTSNFGTVFGLAKDGSGFAVLHSFLGGTDGKNPAGALIEGSDGALYGATAFGNASTRGTVFKLNKDGTGYSVLHTFTGNPDGQKPACKLLEGSDGALYGTTAFGGTTFGGTVFQLQKDGSSYSILYTFQRTGGDGNDPEAGFVEGSDGVLYGTTAIGGTDNVGTVFKLNKDGSGYAILRSFLSTGGDAQRPNCDLMEAADGALYGVTGNGGSGGSGGTIYKINKDGSGYAILRSFAGYTTGDGGTPKCTLLQETNGVFYGTTEDGGDSDGGCVFALSSAPLPPRIVSLSISNGSTVVQFRATSAVQYEVQRSADLSSWSVVSTLTSPTNSEFSFSEVYSPASAAFYRLRQH